MRIRIRIQILASTNKSSAQTNEKGSNRLIFHTFLACRLKIDADPDPVPDPAYHFDVDPDADPDFYFSDADTDPDADPGYQNDADPQHWLIQ